MIATIKKMGSARFSRLSSLAAIALVYCLSACGSGTGPDGPDVIRPAQALQARPVADPTLVEVTDPMVLVATVFVTDSTLHAMWRPSVLLVESSRMAQDSVLLSPSSCLVPEAVVGLPFPHNFLWRDCSRVVLATFTPLDSLRIHNLAELVSGTIAEQIVFAAPLTAPFEGVRAKYSFFVPVGLDATREAMRRLAMQAEAWGADHGLSEPLCKISSTIPPPPCPPWHLQARLRYSFAANPGLDSIPVEPGGWLKVTYPGADGSTRSATYSFPP